MAIPERPRAGRTTPRVTWGKWWAEAEKLAELPRVRGRGYHGLRRQFATEMKDAPLKDLAHLGGWKDPKTLLTCYQMPDEGTQRRALDARRTLKVSGLE